jgi:hypothetical protein
VNNLNIILKELVQNGYVTQQVTAEEESYNANYPEMIPEKISIDCYSIAFKGKILLLDGGYTKKYNLEKEAKEATASARRNEKTIMNLQRGLTRATWILAAGTVALVLVEIYKAFHH